MSTEEAEKVQEIVAEGVAREGLQEMVLPAEEAAAKRLAAFVSDAAIDRMIADAQDAGVSLLDGPGGLIGQLTARVIERALGAEMDDHLGYVKGDPAGNGTGNSRNGSYGKTLTTTSGPVRIIVPRDRKSEFEPQIVVKGQRRVGQVDEMILSLYARGMTTRDIHAHLAEIYGVEVSPALVSAVTNVVTDEITEWQNRPLDAFYAILYIDALVVKVRDGGAVDNRAAYLVTGVDADGFKHVLGIWLGTAEGSRFWAGVLAELRNRGIKDVLFVCCDGLNGLPDAIEATWAQGQSADMRYSPHQGINEIRFLERPEEGCRGDAADLHRAERGRRESGAGETCAATSGRRAPAWSPRGTGPGTSSSRSLNSTPLSGRSSTRPTPSSQLTSSSGRSSRTAVISPATTPRSNCFTSGSGISPAGISTATGWSASEGNAEQALTAGKQP